MISYNRSRYTAHCVVGLSIKAQPNTFMCAYYRVSHLLACSGAHIQRVSVIARSGIAKYNRDPNPVSTRRKNNVIMTPKTTSFWRHNDVIIASCARWESSPMRGRYEVSIMSPCSRNLAIAEMWNTVLYFYIWNGWVIICLINYGINLLIHPKPQRCNRWSFGMDK